MQVEVFKTNICTNKHAERLKHLIQRSFGKYEVNFDLDDCDHVLRVACAHDTICTQTLISFLNKLGCKAELLPD